MKKATHKSSAPVLNNRTLEKDYATLVPFLKEGMSVLDVGCGTGAISKGIAERISATGQVIGIDRSKQLIEEGKALFEFPDNLALIVTGLFDYEPKEKFDLIVAARVLQWLDNPQEALAKMKTWLKPKGQISILDYNHEALAWTPAPPKSMQIFYQGFLDWRSSLGLNNAIAEDLPDYFKAEDLQNIEIISANEVYNKGEENFLHKAGIWIEVAKNVGGKMVTAGFVTEELRLKAMKEHQHWIETEAEQMVMKLNEVRGKH
ncbi:MAG: trans-aconitate 2-methyltransferase [Saprospiraceae bacterium]